MNKCLIIGLLLASSNRTMAVPPVPIPVTAPVLESMQAKKLVTDVKQLAEAVKQSHTLKQTADILNKANELYTKVSTHIKNASTIHNILKEQAELIKEAGTILKRARQNQKNTDAFNDFKYNIASIVTQNKFNVELLHAILSDNFKMTDGERLKTALDIKKDTKEQRTALYKQEFSYRRQQDLQDLIDFYEHMERKTKG